MFGCLLETECDVSTYCFHGDVFQQSIIYKTGYHTLPGLSLFARQEHLYLTPGRINSHSLLSSSHLWHFKCYLLSRLPTSYLFVQSKNLWTLMILPNRKGKGGWGNPNHILKVSNFVRFTKGLPKHQYKRICVYAFQRKGTTLALWSYQKRKENERKTCLYFKQIFATATNDSSIVCGLLGV